MLGERENVKGKVHFLLIGFGDDLVIVDDKTHVQKVDQGGRCIEITLITKSLLQFVVVIIFYCD